MNTIYYVTECGCRLEQEDLIRIVIYTKRGNRNLVSACPIHKKRLTKRTTKCIDCGEEYDFGLSGPCGGRCKACYRVYRLDYLKKEADRARARQLLNDKRPKEKDRDVSRWNCEHWYGKCEEEAVEKDWICRPCKNCKDYSPKPQNFGVYDAPKYRDIIFKMIERRYYE